MNAVLYTLIDGEQMNREHPDTFWMPDLADRRGLRRGDIVKLTFEPVGDGVTERFEPRHVIEIHESTPPIDECARAAMVGALQRNQKKARARRA